VLGVKVNEKNISLSTENQNIAAAGMQNAAGLNELRIFRYNYDENNKVSVAKDE
jgi:hypothetical protein